MSDSLKVSETANIPVYKQSAEYAIEHDELPTYRESFRVNMACRDALEAAIHEAEYSDLLVQKKLDYAALAKAREEARQLQIYKANAEMLLRSDADEQRQTREHQQDK